MSIYTHLFEHAKRMCVCVTIWGTKVMLKGLWTLYKLKCMSLKR